MSEVEMQTAETKVKKPAPRNNQDQIQTNYAGEVERQIGAILQNAETLALVTARGYDTVKLGVGQAKIGAFQAKVNTKQLTLGDLQKAASENKNAFATAKSKVTDLRESVRIAYPKDKAVQQAFGLTDRVPQDQEKFLSYARVGAETAKQAAYAPALQGVGFDSVAYESTIEAFARARATLTVAEQRAKEATAERDSVFQELKDWTQPFRRAVKLALKTRPDLLTPLGL